MSAAMPILPDTIPLADVEDQLRRLRTHFTETGQAIAQRAHMSNLVIFCDRAELADKVAQEIPLIQGMHPARVLLAIGAPGPEKADVAASVNVVCQGGKGRPRICTEQVTLRTQGEGITDLPYAIRGLVIGDLPINVWWVSAEPPPLAGHFLYDLADNAQQIIYDSIGWLEPARGVTATAAWLGKFEEKGGCWRAASDLNWRRLKYWRRLLAQALDPNITPGSIDSITEVLVEHGPHAVIQAWELVSWLASRLHWQVQEGRVQPNVEITWQVQAPHGSVKVRIRRLAEGASAIQRLRIACNLAGKPGALDIKQCDPRRLMVVPEGIDAAPRTMTVQPQPLADLVARQLSDRERDPVFRRSMEVAQVFARSVLNH